MEKSRNRSGIDPRLSRRELLGGISALGTAVALGTSSAVVPAHAQTPKRGGRARIAWSQQSVNDTLNAVRMNQNLDFLRVYSLMSPLIKYGAHFEPEPDLAISWEANADTSVWHFRLRPGVEFQNGKSLTPEDVIYSLNQHRDPRSLSLVATYFSDVVDITKDGPDLVTVTLKAPNPDFPKYLGDPHTVIVPEGFTDWQKPIGTGPFQLVEFRPGIGMLAKRFANHYKADTVFVDEVETFGIADTSNRMDALASGDVHYINRVDAASAKQFQDSQGIDLVVAKASRKLCINMRANGPPFDNLDLRTALKYAVDRVGMLNDVLHDFGQVANDLPIGPNDQYYASDLPQRTYDPDKARDLYKKSGHSGPLELFTSDVNYGAPATDFALHLKESAAKAGIDIRVTRLPVEGYYATVGLKKPFYISNWFPRASLDLELSSVNLSNSPQAEPGYQNPRLDSLALEARRTPDGPKRADLYHEIQKILWDEDGRTIPVFVDFLDGKSKNLNGVKPNPFSEASGLRLCEDIWLS